MNNHTYGLSWKPNSNLLAVSTYDGRIVVIDALTRA